MIVASLTRPAPFWLDSRWSGPGTAGDDAECPLPDEVRAIRALALDHVILIDDARYFLAPPPPPHDWRSWPSLDEALAFLEVPRRCWAFVQDDVIFGVPPVARSVLATTLQRRTAAAAEAAVQDARDSATRRPRMWSILHNLVASIRPLR